MKKRSVARLALASLCLFGLGGPAWAAVGQCVGFPTASGTYGEADTPGIHYNDPDGGSALSGPSEEDTLLNLICPTGYSMQVQTIVMQSESSGGGYLWRDFYYKIYSYSAPTGVSVVALSVDHFVAGRSCSDGEGRSGYPVNWREDSGAESDVGTDFARAWTDGGTADHLHFEFPDGSLLSGGASKTFFARVPNSVGYDNQASVNVVLSSGAECTVGTGAFHPN